MSTLWRYKVFIKWSLTSKVILGHIRPLLAHLFVNRFQSKLVCMLISWRHNFTWNVMEKFCDSSDLQLQPWLKFLWTTYVLVFLYFSKVFWFIKFFAKPNRILLNGFPQGLLNISKNLQLGYEKNWFLFRK